MAEATQEFTRFETARIIGARALQISMDAPLLIKITEAELEVMHYDALKIASKEFYSGVLPISVRRPMPTKTGAKLQPIRDESMDDEKIIEKEKEVEKEIAEKAEEMGLVNENDNEEAIIEDNSAGSEE
ncbi:DNA-directed RNA polymerase subunit K [Candidatus Pacearchaeota archaeon]|nr:DNA-directed RNA polymerase subunit K [Candidatus Pacearchaeota archaeon]